MSKNFDTFPYIEEQELKLEHLKHQYKMATDEIIKESILEQIDSKTEEIKILKDF